MQIIEMKVLRGPNYWSVKRHRLIVMKLDIGELEEQPTHKIKGFADRLEKLLPSLYEHECSEGKEGGFLSRVREGTWMGHVIEHVALEIQTLAGMDCGFGRTRRTKTKGVYNIVFAYLEEQVGIYAAHAAIKIVETLIKGEPYELAGNIRAMRELRAQVRFGPSTHSIVAEAIARDIPFARVNNDSLVQLGYGKNQVRIRATVTSRTSSLAVDLAGNKNDTKRLLQEAYIPVADGVCISTIGEMENALRTLGYPLVFKPVDGNQGKGATINIRTRAETKAAFEHAKRYSYNILIEQYIEGHDYRVLVIDNKFVAAALRIPAHVTGDGRSSIQQLISIENLDPRRGAGHENMLTEIQIDRETLTLLGKKGYSPETVLKKNELCYLKGTANLSTGGTSTDVTELIHPAIVSMCERISRLIGLDICGIDIMAPNLHEPLEKTGGVILEVNAAPGFRMHLAPSHGAPRNVAAPVLDMLYPPGTSSRIPIIAITGTNGKTTTTRLIAHMAKGGRYKVGFTTTDGIYIDDVMMVKGDTTGPRSAGFILRDPSVELAVLETARGGILRSGLAFDKCDVAVLTNVQEDHMGLSDINTLEEMTKVKSTVTDCVKPNGYAVFNADNKYCVSAAESSPGHIAYFSMSEGNPVISEHCKNGGMAAVCDNGYITIKKGSWKIRISKIVDIPLTFEGKVPFMVQNVLAATLAAYVFGIEAGTIAASLETFFPSAELTPGRMNIFEFRNFKVMIDYAHNPDGFRGVKEFLATIQSPQKIGIITGTGDRRDNDIRELGRISAQMFDHIIIRQDKYLRGRTEEEMVKLLTEGVLEENSKQSYEYVSKEIDALKHALRIAKPGAFITALSDAIDNAIEVVQHYQEKEKELQAS